PRADDLEFVIAGIDNSAGGRNQQEIEALVKELGLTSRVRLLDSIVDVPNFLAGLDVFVSASRSEAFGLAIVEAMASGVPVVATRTAGAEEVIEHDQTGRLVPVRDVEGLAQAISELSSDKRQRQFLSVNARRMVTERFSLERMVRETEQLYREIGRA